MMTATTVKELKAANQQLKAFLAMTPKQREQVVALLLAARQQQTTREVRS